MHSSRRPGCPELRLLLVDGNKCTCGDKLVFLSAESWYFCATDVLILREPHDLVLSRSPPYNRTPREKEEEDDRRSLEKDLVPKHAEKTLTEATGGLNGIHSRILYAPIEVLVQVKLDTFSLRYL